MGHVLSIILLVALIPAGAFSNVPPTSVVVPGHRISQWTLQMTLAQFGRAVGHPPDSRGKSELELADLAASLDAYCASGICAFYRTPKELTYLRVAQISKFSRTEKGPGVGSPLAEVLAAYGQPTARTQIGDDFAGFIRLIYDDLGIAFRGNVVTETVISISVFRPGTARSIWRF